MITTQPQNGTWDVAVIGAGVFGAWTAYQLAHTGRAVLLVDAYGAGDPRSSSGAESRLTRMAYGTNDLYTRFSHKSLLMWKQLFDESGKHLFHQTGVLWIVDPEDDRLASSREAMIEAGIPFEDLNSLDIQRRYPQFHFNYDVAAVLEPDSGVLLAGAAVRAVVEAARSRGVEYVQVKVRTPVVNGEVITQSGMQLKARAFVFACGAWLPKLFPEVAGDLILPTRQPLFFVELPAGSDEFLPPRLPAWMDHTDSRLSYGCRDFERHAMKTGFHRLGPPFDPDSDDRLATNEEAELIREYIANRFPGLAKAPIIASRVCQYENSTNGDFLIDRHPEFPHIWLVGGGSGHGFKHGPAVGDYVAGRLENRVPEETRFSLQAKFAAAGRSVI